MAVVGAHADQSLVVVVVNIGIVGLQLTANGALLSVLITEEALLALEESVVVLQEAEYGA